MFLNVIWTEQMGITIINGYTNSTIDVTSNGVESQHITLFNIMLYVA